MSLLRIDSSPFLGPTPDADAFGMHSTIRVSAFVQPADPVIQIRRVAHSFVRPAFARHALRGQTKLRADATGPARFRHLGVVPTCYSRFAPLTGLVLRLLLA